MIQETIVITQNAEGLAHIAPMGIHVAGNELLIQPFKPSTTLENLLETGVAVVNFTDDVRVFAGCLTGRKNWPLKPAEKVNGQILAVTLAHDEVKVVRVEDHELRPKLFCTAIHSVNHAPFRGFNRAQFSVLEAAILISRLHMLPVDKIESELEYLKIGLEKTASERELEAWGWLMKAFDYFKSKNT
jgi:uncharacterized protein